MSETRRRGHSILFPLLLILAGVYFLAYNLGWTRIDPWDAFSTFWPVILIALGLDIVLARANPWISGLVAIFFVVVLFLISGTHEMARMIKEDTCELSSQAVMIPIEEATEGKLFLQFAGGDINVKAGNQESSYFLEGSVRLPVKETLEVEQILENNVLKVTLSESRAKHHIRLHGLQRNQPKDRLTLNLNRTFPTALDLNLDAVTADLNLEDTTVTDLTLDLDAGTGRVRLPVLSKEVEGSADISIDVGTLTLWIPESCSARIHTNTDISTRIIDEERFPRKGEDYESENFDSSPCRWTLKIDADVSTVTVK
ncbi:MAG TPA: DUF5668 domain-containing protein [Thermoanaerobaculia bacterium]|nr:DUF5668 domain-containing protein [Thermoanaerobaculia bacterium]HUM31239.1 DUF5668 domain-containing protein [Thermoanaerobaculia bacterium]HXK69593.1 DUF5668 domain-containing protein [Thermoanaerobaculia bacterium]